MKNGIGVLQLVLFIGFIASPFLINAQLFLDYSQNLPFGVTAEQSKDVQMVDLNNDNRLDIVIAVEYSLNLIMMNNGFGQFNISNQQNLPQEILDSEEIAIADFDGNGSKDIIFVSEDDFEHEYYLNDGNGNFSVASYTLPSTSCSSIIAADFNGDGHQDILLGNIGQNMLLINNGNGSWFNNETAQRLPSIAETTRDLKLEDVNGDGHLDIIEGNEGNIRLLINNGAGYFTDQSSSRLPNLPTMEVNKTVLGDIDADGDLDIFVCNVEFLLGQSAQNRLLRNDNGFFVDVTSSIPQSNDQTIDAVFTDIDADGDQDLITGNVLNATLKLYRNFGNGEFYDATLSSLATNYDVEAYGFFITDINGDGLNDLYVCNRGGADLLLYKNANYQFDADPTPLAATKVEEESITLFPNPVSNQLIIKFQLPLGSNTNFELYSSTGKLIKPLQTSINDYEVTITLPASLAKGIYFLQFKQNNKIYTKKIIKN